MRIVICSGLLGLSLIGFALSTYLWLSLLILPVIGFTMMQHMAASNTILQTIVDDQKRGRVMSFFSMAFQGMAPFGSLLAGVLAAHIGTRWTLVASGLFCAAGSLWFRRKLGEIRTILRPVYVRLGILPEAALGVEQATALQTTEAS
jgi:MFS family permease